MAPWQQVESKERRLGRNSEMVKKESVYLETLDKAAPDVKLEIGKIFKSFDRNKNRDKERKKSLRTFAMT